MKTLITALVVVLGLLLPTAAPASVTRSASPAEATTISIPVLCYHVVSTNPSGRYQLSLAKFQEQMAYLANNGFTTLSMDEYYSIMTLQTPAPAKPIVLTFDDSTADFATNVVPVLRQYGFKATQFAVSSWVNTPGYLSSSVAAGKTTPTDNFLALNRLMIVSSETLSSFIKKVS